MNDERVLLRPLRQRNSARSAHLRQLRNARLGGDALSRGARSAPAGGARWYADDSSVPSGRAAHLLLPAHPESPTEQGEVRLADVPYSKGFSEKKQAGLAAILVLPT